MSKQADGSFILTPEEHKILREMFLHRGRSVGIRSFTVASLNDKLCEMIQSRTRTEYEQYC